MIYTLFPDLNDRAPQRRKLFVRFLFHLDKGTNVLFSNDVQILFRMGYPQLERAVTGLLPARPGKGGPCGLHRDSPPVRTAAAGLAVA